LDIKVRATLEKLFKTGFSQLFFLKLYRRERELLFQNTTVKEIVEKYRTVWALNHSSAVLGWDLETHMPEEGAKPRAVATAEIALLRQKLILSLKDLVERAERQDLADLNDYEKGVIRVLRRAIDYNTKIPPELVEKLQKIRAESTLSWRIARKKSDFSIFRPYLEKIVELKREEAEKLGYVKHPYDALLDLPEEGLTVEIMDKIFATLVPALKRILEKVESKQSDGDNSFPMKNHPLESVKYGEGIMEKVNAEILKILGMPEKSFRMDISTHPFTTGIALKDVRITTRYEGIDFRASMFATIHECGHAIYNLQISDELEYTPLRSGASSGIHESQSRFWENIVGRSRQFVQVVAPMLKEKLAFLKNYGEDDLYAYFNLVKPSSIRVDADELTYNFHIALRYEIEKRIIGGEIGAREIPSIWNETMMGFLGIKPKSDSEGLLQDIHWSGGSFGGFPSYTIGNVVDGMIWHRIQTKKQQQQQQQQQQEEEKKLNLEDTIASARFDLLKAWLKDNIHNFGATYSPQDLMKRTFGEGYNPEWLVRYLESKYLA